jgi:hypothetical protein
MSFKSSVVLCGLAVFACSAALRAEERAEPCLPQFAAASLIANLLDIGMTTGELRLLNGNEDPKLRRHLEYRLAVAARDARLHINQKPDIAAAHLPSFVSGVDRAIRYVTEHPPDQKSLEQLHVAMPAENLEYVRAWVARQPWAAPRSAAPSPN